MRKIRLLLCSITVVGSLYFTQSSEAVVPFPESAENKVVTGEVVYVSLANPALGTKSEIVVMDDKGRAFDLVIRSGSAIFDKTGKKTALDGIKKGDKVIVEYREKQLSAATAQSIKLVE